MLQLSNIDDAVQVFLDPARHHEMTGAALQLPDWFDRTLDPASPTFRSQIVRLWREITGRQDYDPAKDEDTPEVGEMDAVLRPAYYGTGDARVAGMHLIAMGHILTRAGVGAGARVLECGAGFGRNALAFARLGAKVDTIDIGAGFCDMVRQAAAFYKVDLTPHQVPFGTNPSGEDGAYDLILFYESFHHCLEFRAVIPQLVRMLKPDGKILLAGEPVCRGPIPEMPYPWGIGLCWSTVAVMRIRGWMELGFQEEFLVRQFAENGMSWRYFREEISDSANIYEFRRWREPIELNSANLTASEEQSWHGAEPNGRWTTDLSRIAVPSHDGKIAVDIVNFHPIGRTGTFRLGAHAIAFSVPPGGRHEIVFPPQPEAQKLILEIASDTYVGSEHDGRSLGIFVERIRPA